MRLSLSLIGLCTVGMLWVGCLAMAGWQISTVYHAGGNVDRARILAINARNLLVACLDAETGQRGYLLTGDDRFRAPYDAGLTMIGNRLAELHRTAAGTEQAQAVNALDRLTSDKIAQMQATMAMRVKGRMTVRVEVISHLSAGKNIMDQIRLKLDELQLWSNSQVDIYLPETSRSTYWAGASVIASLLLGFSVFSWIVSRMQVLATNGEHRGRAGTVEMGAE